MVNLYGFGPALMAGTWVTFQVMTVSLVVGLVAGMAGALLKLSGIRVLAWATELVTTVIRGVPELIIILFAYYGFGILASGALARIGIQAHIQPDPFSASVGSLGAVFGAYATDIFRMATCSVGKGQVEAARAVGMGPVKVFRRVMLPQIWRFALPGLGNLFLILQKDTALVSVIGLHELMRNAAAGVALTRRPFLFYLVAAFIYLAITTVTTGALQWLERRATRCLART